MRFINETTLDRKTLDTLTKIGGQTVKRRQVLFLRLLCLGIGLSGLFLGFFYNTQSPIVSSLAQVYGVIFFVAGIFWYPVQSFANIPAGLQKEVRTMEFTDKGFYSLPPKGDHVFLYEDLKALVQSEFWFVLFWDEKHGLILDKETFLEGTPEEFYTFIQEKTGLMFHNIK